MEKNESLDSAIAQANKLADTEYKRKTNELNDNAKKLENEKTKYQDMAAASLESGTGTTGQIEKYEIEYLWTKIGNYATSEGVDVDMKVESLGSAQDVYNLNFTVSGSYIGIEEFISDIENDSSLGFKIEQFALKGSDESLTGTFICRNIMIQNVNSTPLPSQSETDEDTKDSNTTNNTNSTSNTTRTNSTNNTNSTNSTKTSDDIANSVINAQ